METIPSHRQYVNKLITSNIIEHYIVSMETQQIWITLNAKNKAEAEKLLNKMPLKKYTEYEITEVYLYDGVTYRPVGFMLN